MCSHSARHGGTLVCVHCGETDEAIYRFDFIDSMIVRKTQSPIFMPWVLYGKWKHVERYHGPLWFWWKSRNGRTPWLDEIRDDPEPLVWI